MLGRTWHHVRDQATSDALLPRPLVIRREDAISIAACGLCLLGVLRVRVILVHDRLGVLLRATDLPWDREADTRAVGVEACLRGPRKRHKEPGDGQRQEGEGRQGPEDVAPEDVGAELGVEQQVPRPHPAAQTERQDGEEDERDHEARQVVLQEEAHAVARPPLARLLVPLRGVPAAAERAARVDLRPGQHGRGEPREQDGAHVVQQQVQRRGARRSVGLDAAQHVVPPLREAHKLDQGALQAPQQAAGDELQALEAHDEVQELELVRRPREEYHEEERCHDAEVQGAHRDDHAGEYGQIYRVLHLSPD
mmetsp:Transcript_51591/g.162140  ORF Transcript_51591/g.162140 Transcript_51591/m.162140 type:complete len:309 (+) Transcript_51591:357-1283(+)